METQQNNKSFWIEIAVLVGASLVTSWLTKGKCWIEDSQDRRQELLKIDRIVADPVQKTGYRRGHDSNGNYVNVPYDKVVENYWIVFEDRTVMRVNNNIRHLLFAFKDGEEVLVESIKPIGASFREIVGLKLHPVLEGKDEKTD